MSEDLMMQVRNYTEFFVSTVEPITRDEISERPIGIGDGLVRVIRPLPATSHRRGLLVAAVASVVVLVLVGGVALLFDQAESAVVNREDDEVDAHLSRDLSRYNFGLDEADENGFGVINEDGEEFLARGEQLLLSCADIAMVGAHNQANALAALATGHLMGLELPAMLQVLNEFPGLPHRMQFVNRYNGVNFINDSKATNVGAAIAAVMSVAGPVVLIAGGQGKGGDFDAFAKSVFPRLRSAILIGEDAPQLEQAFASLADTEMATSMQPAVARAIEIAESGDTVLLAPACASFDQYENYQARGEEFCRAVTALTR